jgi:LytS/YehU family sensor histidine kinase
MPALMMLPLVGCVLGRASEAGRRASLRIAASADRRRLRLEITDGSPGRDAPEDDVLRGVRERLDALYGTAASLAWEAPGTAGSRLVMEIPYEPADGDHR